ncbi:hypothetical protein [Lewinella sp. W8]|uniref:hypothetical protein n=1 Tax=Lewinella sp. W8 TaxID=2528208 RepID=UPI0010680FC7|nr:hypothetical protein [Lewinella sp. W8]
MFLIPGIERGIREFLWRYTNIFDPFEPVDNPENMPVWEDDEELPPAPYACEENPEPILVNHEVLGETIDVDFELVTPERVERLRANIRRKTENAGRHNLTVNQ